jgi:hypothetical protein
MQVSFGATVDEITDAHLRLFFETEAAHRDRLVTSIATAGLTAAAVWYLLSGTLAATSILIALVVAAVVYHLSGREYDRVVRTKARKLVVEQMGGEDPVPMSVAVSPDGLVIEQLGATMRFEWNRILKMVDRPNGVEFVAARPKALMVVRSRAFPSVSDRATFVRLARKYLGSNGSLSVEEAAEPA